MRPLAVACFVLASSTAHRALAAEPSPAALIEAAASCPLGAPLESPPSCPERTALTRDYSQRFAAYAGLGHRFLADPRPAVRAFAVRIVGDRLVDHKDDLDALVTLFATESEPRVRQEIIDALSDWAGEPAVGPTLLRAADDPDAGVRYEALEALTGRFARDVAGAFDKVLAAVERDPHPSVRRNACRLIGKLGDDRALPVLEAQATRGASLDAASCLWGIVDAWTVAPKPSRAAFEATLRILARTPRSPDMSYSMALTSVPQIFVVLGLEAYRARAPWFDVALLRQAALALVLDRQVGGTSRLDALAVVGHTDPSHAELAPVLAAYADATHYDDVELLARARALDAKTTH